LVFRRKFLVIYSHPFILVYISNGTRAEFGNIVQQQPLKSIST